MFSGYGELGCRRDRTQCSCPRKPALPGNICHQHDANRAESKSILYDIVTRREYNFCDK
jgi:hypothetical protein